MASSRQEAYPPATVEERLQARDLAGALEAGWWGDEVGYGLVESGLGGRHLKVMLEQDMQHYRVDLGLYLSNETGVTTVAAIYPGGSAAREGQLRSGDVIRQVLRAGQAVSVRPQRETCNTQCGASRQRAESVSPARVQVNGKTHFTCEAIVAAIKSSVSSPIVLGAVSAPCGASLTARVAWRALPQQRDAG